MRGEKKLRFQGARMLLVALAVLFFGCPINYDPAGSGGVLVDGEAYDMALEIREDGTLYATEALIEQDFEEAVIKGEVESVSQSDGSFVMFGGLVVVISPENGDDDDEDDEVDEFNYADADDLAFSEIEEGMWVEATGNIGSDGTFSAQIVSSGDQGVSEMLAMIDSHTTSAFTALGLEVTYDSETEINTGECPTTGGN